MSRSSLSIKRQTRNTWVANLLIALPLSDRHFIALMYLARQKSVLRLAHPATFSAKCQWLKLFASYEQYAALADKYRVREYVSRKVGSHVLNELYAVYRDEREIDFDQLPAQFVLKATHGSGWNILCRDKRTLNTGAVRAQLRQWLARDYFVQGREPVYKNIPPRIICERLLEDKKPWGLLDYKFFCFHGRAAFVQVDFDRHTAHTRNIYDRDWALCPFRYMYGNNPSGIGKPRSLESMIAIAEALAEGIPFVRVDLYDVNGTVLFGELTFFPEGGFGRILPVEWDARLGSYLDLSLVGKEF